MECYYCKGTMIKDKAPLTIDRHNYHITWQAVPAWVCTQCGEAMFDEHETQHIQNALQQIDHETMAFALHAA